MSKVYSKLACNLLELNLNDKKAYYIYAQFLNLTPIVESFPYTNKT